MNSVYRTTTIACLTNDHPIYIFYSANSVSLSLSSRPFLLSRINSLCLFCCSIINVAILSLLDVFSVSTVQHRQSEKKLPLNIHLCTNRKPSHPNPSPFGCCIDASWTNTRTTFFLPLLYVVFPQEHAYMSLFVSLDQSSPIVDVQEISSFRRCLICGRKHFYYLFFSKESILYKTFTYISILHIFLVTCERRNG